MASVKVVGGDVSSGSVSVFLLKYIVVHRLTTLNYVRLTQHNMKNLLVTMLLNIQCSYPRAVALEAHDIDKVSATSYAVYSIGLWPLKN